MSEAKSRAPEAIPPNSTMEEAGAFIADLLQGFAFEDGDSCRDSYHGSVRYGSDSASDMDDGHSWTLNMDEYSEEESRQSVYSRSIASAGSSLGEFDNTLQNTILDEDVFKFDDTRDSNDTGQDVDDDTKQQSCIVPSPSGVMDFDQSNDDYRLDFEGYEETDMCMADENKEDMSGEPSPKRVDSAAKQQQPSLDLESQKVVTIEPTTKSSHNTETPTKMSRQPTNASLSDSSSADQKGSKTSNRSKGDLDASAASTSSMLERSLKDVSTGSIATKNSLQCTEGVSATRLSNDDDSNVALIQTHGATEEVECNLLHFDFAKEDTSLEAEDKKEETSQQTLPQAPKPKKKKVLIFRKRNVETNASSPVKRSQRGGVDEQRESKKINDQIHVKNTDICAQQVVCATDPNDFSILTEDGIEAVQATSLAKDGQDPEKSYFEVSQSGREKHVVVFRGSREDFCGESFDNAPNGWGNENGNDTSRLTDDGIEAVHGISPRKGMEGNSSYYEESSTGNVKHYAIYENKEDDSHSETATPASTSENKAMPPQKNVIRQQIHVKKQFKDDHTPSRLFTKSRAGNNGRRRSMFSPKALKKAKKTIGVDSDQSATSHGSKQQLSALKFKTQKEKRFHDQRAENDNKIIQAKMVKSTQDFRVPDEASETHSEDDESEIRRKERQYHVDEQFTDPPVRRRKMLSKAVHFFQRRGKRGNDKPKIRPPLSPRRIENTLGNGRAIESKQLSPAKSIESAPEEYDAQAVHSVLMDEQVQAQKLFSDEDNTENDNGHGESNIEERIVAERDDDDIRTAISMITHDVSCQSAPSVSMGCNKEKSITDHMNYFQDTVRESCVMPSTDLLTVRNLSKAFAEMKTPELFGMLYSSDENVHKKKDFDDDAESIPAVARIDTMTTGETYDITYRTNDDDTIYTDMMSMDMCTPVDKFAIPEMNKQELMDLANNHRRRIELLPNLLCGGCMDVNSQSAGAQEQTPSSGNVRKSAHSEMVEAMSPEEIEKIVMRKRMLSPERRHRPKMNSLLDEAGGVKGDIVSQIVFDLELTESELSGQKLVVANPQATMRNILAAPSPRKTRQSISRPRNDKPAILQLPSRVATPPIQAGSTARARSEHLKKNRGQSAQNVHAPRAEPKKELSTLKATAKEASSKMIAAKRRPPMPERKGGMNIPTKVAKKSGPTNDVTTADVTSSKTHLTDLSLIMVKHDNFSNTRTQPSSHKLVPVTGKGRESGSLSPLQNTKSLFYVNMSAGDLNTSTESSHSKYSTPVESPTWAFKQQQPQQQQEESSLSFGDLPGLASQQQRQQDDHFLSFGESPGLVSQQQQQDDKFAPFGDFANFDDAFQEGAFN